MSQRTTEQRAFDRIVYSIPPSLSDIVLRAWGYDLRREYLKIIRSASLQPGSPVLELSTGSGRMASLLARSGHQVISGDLVDEKLPEARRRIGPAHAGHVGFLLLNIEVLPFPSGSVSTIVCLNTLHELPRPDRALEELLRVHSGEGPLVLGDFNERGFDVMQQLHRVVYRNDHPRGHMPIHEAKNLIERRYARVQSLATPLNETMIATARKELLAGERANPFL